MTPHTCKCLAFCADLTRAQSCVQCTPSRLQITRVVLCRKATRFVRIFCSSDCSLLKELGERSHLSSLRRLQLQFQHKTCSVLFRKGVSSAKTPICANVWKHAMQIQRAIFATSHPKMQCRRRDPICRCLFVRVFAEFFWVHVFRRSKRFPTKLGFLKFFRLQLMTIHHSPMRRTLRRRKVQEKQALWAIAPCGSCPLRSLTGDASILLFRG